MRHKLRPLTKEEIDKLPVSKHSPIDKIDKSSRPFAYRRLIEETVKEHHKKAIINSQEEKQ